MLNRFHTKISVYRFFLLDLPAACRVAVCCLCCCKTCLDAIRAATSIFGFFSVLINLSIIFSFSAEMMGHPELLSECDINQLEPLLPRDVVDDLLSKYVKTFTVSTLIETLMDAPFNLISL